MIGNPLSLQEWNRCFKADVAEKVFLLVMPFHERPLEPRPVKDRDALVAKITKALEGIGMPADNIRIISTEEVLHPLDWMSENDRRQIRTELCGSVAASIDRALGAVMLEMAPLIVTKEIRFVDGLRGVKDIYVENLKRMSVGGRFAKLVASNLFKCLQFQIGFLAANRPADAAKIAPFTEMYADGHFSLGKTRDNTLIAVTG